MKRYLLGILIVALLFGAVILHNYKGNTTHQVVIYQDIYDMISTSGDSYWASYNVLTPQHGWVSVTKQFSDNITTLIITYPIHNEIKP